ncbi:MAG: hypothetical protein SFT93_05985, partial [Rickettsiaceae bacterium]|nr:hypothetical protein [Rickettsiaceae bacterium]
MKTYKDNFLAYFKKWSHHWTTDNKKSEHYFETSSTLIILFGVFGVINFPVFHFIFKGINSTEYHDFNLRMVAGFLCFTLALLRLWPKQLKKILPIYWYVCVLYCIPFLGTYFYLMNQESNIWLVNVILGLFWMILVLDWISFTILLPLGIFIGYQYYAYNSDIIYINSSNFELTVINIIWVIITSLIFAQKRDSVHYEVISLNQKLDSLTHALNDALIQKTKALLLKDEFIRNLSHEVRTPLTGIVSVGSYLASNWDS